jgi:hypothetical protein
MKRLIAAVAYFTALAYSAFRRSTREMPHECWPDCTSPVHFDRHIPSVADAWQDT